MMRRIKSYIHDLTDWPRFHWKQERLAGRLAEVRHRQGRLIGRMESLGFQFRAEAVLKTLTEDVLKSSEIEGEMLDRDQVRSSIARRLGIDIGGLTAGRPPCRGRRRDDARCDATLCEPLTGGQALRLARGAISDRAQRHVENHGRRMARRQIRPHAGGLRPDRQENASTMKRRRAGRLRREMKKFLDWFNKDNATDLVLKAGIAHLWFVTIHPFDDGNGRIARAIADMVLARSEKSAQRFYSMSAQIRQERKAYYEILEATQKDDLDITPWLEWFLDCLGRAFERAETTLAAVLKKARFWEQHAGASFNDRQRNLINRLLNGFEGKLTSSKWAKLAKCSQDTALRDIEDLVRKGILVKDAAGGRSTSYSLAEIA